MPHYDTAAAGHQANGNGGSGSGNSHDGGGSGSSSSSNNNNKTTFSFASRRSTVYSTRGVVACSQPLAARCGAMILDQGGNAADAAVAVAAALNMTEPCNTGIGGDAFCLYYDAASKKVRSLNGSGRAPAAATLDRVREAIGWKEGDWPKIPLASALAVTVPGAAGAWVDTVERFGSGKVTLAQVLAPAIELAENGYPVSENCAAMWVESEDLLRSQNPDGCAWLIDGKAPQAGQTFRNPDLAQTFRLLAEKGKRGFYEGPVAEAIAKTLHDRGAFMTIEDLKHHGDTGSQDTGAVSLDYEIYPDQPVRLWEHPPNGQGLVALMALGILRELQQAGKIPRFSAKDHNTAEYLHAVIEAFRIAFADGHWFIADPDLSSVPIDKLVSSEYLLERSKLFDPTKAKPPPEHGSPALRSSDTVYLSVTDADGNGCSFINSNFNGFGTAIVAPGFGFSLQNRGAGFDLTAGRPNCIEPRKRPYHTIIPPMLTDPRDDSLVAVYGVMGGVMQPQGHVQVLLNMLAFGMSPQEALDAPRIRLGPGTDHEGADDGTVYIEGGISEAVQKELEALGHKLSVTEPLSAKFGRGQVIRCRTEAGKLVYSAGSDPRGDGHAIPML